MSGSTGGGLTVACLLLAAVVCWVETVLRSASRSRLKEWADHGHHAAQKALELSHPNTPVYSVLRWTIGALGLAAAGLATATLWRPLEALVDQCPGLGAMGQSSKIAFAVLLLGLGLAWGLIVEVLPRRLAEGLADRAALWIAGPVAFWIRLLRPLYRSIEAVASPVVFLLRGRHPQSADLSLEEIEHWLQVGATAGLIAPSEEQVAQRALRFGDRTVRQIMRPRIEIDAIDVDTPAEQVIGVVAMSGFSRLPVYEGDIDHIIGFVYTKDLLRQQHLGWPIELRKLIRPALMVPGSLSIDRLLEMFRQNRVQMAIVLDEYGGTEGLVTLEDVLEELVGEIHDEHRLDPEEQLVQQDKQTWLVDARMHLEDFLTRIGSEDLHSPEIHSFHTLAGLVLAVLDRIPKPGDCLQWHNFQIEVVQMTGMRIDRLLVKLLEEPQ